MEYFVLNNGVKIPAIGFGTGIAKGFSIHPTYAIKRIIKEIAKIYSFRGLKKIINIRFIRILKRI